MLLQTVNFTRYRLIRRTLIVFPGLQLLLTNVFKTHLLVKASGKLLAVGYGLLTYDFNNS